MHATYKVRSNTKTFLFGVDNFFKFLHLTPMRECKLEEGTGHDEVLYNQCLFVFIIHTTFLGTYKRICLE